MRRGFLSALVVGLSLTVASAAYAQQPQQQPIDTVELRSGGVVRGTIVELLPGDHVTIQLPSGLKTFPWGEVSRVERAGAQPQGPVYTAPPGTTPAPEPLVQPGEPATRVYIDASSPVSLFHMDNRGDVKTACIAPCGETLPFTGLYWVAGKDINASDKFQLPPGKAETKLHVTGGSKGTVTAGIVLAVVGGNIFLIGGLILLGVGAVAAAPTSRTGDLGGAWAVSTTLTAVGLTMGIVGIVLWLTNNSSSVEAYGKNNNFIAPTVARKNWMGGF
jgi:hypothetical protein